MDIDTQRYYDSLFEMYATDGWKNLMQDLKEHAEQYKSIKNAFNENSLFLQKGRLDEVEFLLNHEETMRAAYEEIKNAAV